MSSLAELAFDVNQLTFTVSDPLMLVEFKIDNPLAPVPSLPLEQHPVIAYLAGLGNDRSRDTQKWAIINIAAFLSGGQCNPLTLPWWLIRRPHVNAVRGWLIQDKQPATGKRYMAALRGTLKECWRSDLMTTDDYMKAIDVKPIEGSKPDQAAGRALSAGEFAALLRVCAEDTSAAGVRDAALLGLGALGGLRRAEMAALSVEDYREGVLWVQGKRNKTRTVPVAAGVQDALADWLHVRSYSNFTENFQETFSLFLAINKGGRILSQGMTAPAIYKVFEKRAEQAGVKAFSPHDLRRSFAGDLLDAGADIATVQKLMGHASVSTTASYDRRGQRAMQTAISKLHMSWPRRFTEEA